MANGQGGEKFLACPRHLSSLVDLALKRSTATSVSVVPIEPARERPEALAAQEAIARRKRAEQTALRALRDEHSQRYEQLVRMAYLNETRARP
ncbi:hypothetical protein [Streptomyces sp. NPDC050485]|uniref:hypothetical protein n=1 Tax=Streptomyces sp. NPDC050485 TaxID=3365617 RepID=UPI00378A307E